MRSAALLAIAAHCAWTTGTRWQRPSAAMQRVRTWDCACFSSSAHRIALLRLPSALLTQLPRLSAVGGNRTRCCVHRHWNVEASQRQVFEQSKVELQRYNHAELRCFAQHMPHLRKLKLSWYSFDHAQLMNVLREFPMQRLTSL